jgi:hypothetical protein
VTSRLDAAELVAELTNPHLVAVALPTEHAEVEHHDDLPVDERRRTVSTAERRGEPLDRAPTDVHGGAPGAKDLRRTSELVFNSG